MLSWLHALMRGDDAQRTLEIIAALPYAHKGAGAAAPLSTANYIGVPVSTTHTIRGAIVGVGGARRVSAVRWNVAAGIVWAWVITMPLSGLLAAGFYFLARFADRMAG